jgi:hypothetical protein
MLKKLNSMTKNSCGPRIMKLNRLWTTHYEAEVTSLNSPSPSCVDMKKKKKKKEKKLDDQKQRAIVFQYIICIHYENNG